MSRRGTFRLGSVPAVRKALGVRTKGERRTHFHLGSVPQARERLVEYRANRRFAKEKAARAGRVYKPTQDQLDDKGYMIPGDFTRDPQMRTVSVEAGFRDPESGEIWGTGIVHDSSMLPEDSPIHNYDYMETAVLIDPTGTKWQSKFDGEGWRPIEKGQLVSREYVLQPSSGGRKSGSGGGGGEVEVSGYTRGGTPVSPYTRSRPSR